LISPTSATPALRSSTDKITAIRRSHRLLSVSRDESDQAVLDSEGWVLLGPGQEQLL